MPVHVEDDVRADEAPPGRVESDLCELLLLPPLLVTSPIVSLERRSSANSETREEPPHTKEMTFR